MNNGPVASNLVLLAELDKCAPGTKVRFLGCVDDYVVGRATLRLKHNYPASATPKTACVDIEHVLESIKRYEVDVGSWINVIGYVERQTTRNIHVQAVAVWDAGNIDLDAYQNAIDKRKEAS
ncbi:hypothetical protein GRF29_19g1398489 [Pseudopithomyces chartarum]|uniref:CST complex subunit Ten1 n=1 Tax=Pseudopithomyces chartarum TaxID=1892770 RepID=A0AAN6M5U7_9PLEO|nr:hypothetical protein GRF29_19g1398489 [Pseudopithomyces chartarum]